MANLSDLSNEVIEMIMSHVFPPDIELLAQTSKSIRSLAAPFVRNHREWRAELGRLADVENPPYYRQLGEPQNNLARLLLLILQDARVGLYVSKITVWDWQCRWEGQRWNEGGDPDIVSSWYRHFEPNEIEILKSGIRDSGLTANDDEVGCWVNKIRNGKEWPVILLLLLHTPNLENLNIKAIRDVKEPDNLVYENCLRDVFERNHGSHLQYLKHVRCNSRCHKFRTAKSFMELPSIDSLCLQRLHVTEGERDLEWSLQSQKSSVSHLFFTHCYIDPEALFELISTSHGLKSFSYTFPSHKPGVDSGWGAYWIIPGLVIHAGHSLERLVLDAGVYADDKIGSLRGLKVLRGLDIDLSLLIDVHGRRESSLADMLPSSIEWIRIQIDGDQIADDPEDLRSVLLGVVEAKRTRLRQLKGLCLPPSDGPEDELSKEFFHDFPELCAEQDIQFSIHCSALHASGQCLKDTHDSDPLRRETPAILGLWKE